MKVGILGTGMVGQTIAAKLAENGDDVMIGTRDVQATLAKDKPDMMGNPPFRVWHDKNHKVKVGTFADTAAHAQLVVNALSGQASIEGLKMAGEKNIAGKIVVDISNPLDFSKGMPPSLFMSNTTSLGEEIQKAFPNAKVVKTLNTVNAYLMVDPKKLKDGDHTMFVSGNDAAAKAEVTAWLKKSFGWSDVLDLGDLTTARGSEMAVALWARVWMSTNNPMFAFKVVR
jgi:predicted dinucleotide-binding enzyme